MGSEQAMKWMNLVGVLRLQACSGTNFYFSDYSSSLKEALQIGQIKLNNLAMASDLGKALGWTSGYAMRRMPLWAVMFIASFIGLVSSGLLSRRRYQPSTGRSMRFGRPWWMCVALIPLPPAFFYLATGAAASLYVGTCVLGMCSGYIISAAVSTSAELFGIDSFGVNHNIVIANIPLGSLLFGYMAALIYDYNAHGGEIQERKLGSMVVCMGENCYKSTFIIWGCISLVGLILNSILVLRTRRVYEITYKLEEEREVHSM